MRKISIRKPITVILTFEGLASSALGCYGSSWNETPSIDELAAGGVVWDRWTSPDERRGHLLSRWISESGRVLSAHAIDRDSVFVSDDVDFPRSDQSLPFSSSIKLSPSPSSSFAESMHDTRYASTVAAAIDATTPDTRLLWIHSSFLRDQWDAPATQQDAPNEEPSEPEEHPDPDEADVMPAGPSFALPENSTVPRIQCSDQDDPDMMFAWMNRYGDQVKMIDETLDWLRGTLSDRRLTIMVAGCSGFSLGENGWIGHECGPLRSCNTRLPMLVSAGGPLRIPTLHSAGGFSELLSRVLRKAPLATPAEWSQSDQEFTPVVETLSERASTAITSAKWFYVVDRITEIGASGTEKLYLKPDDVNDVNDVSRLRRDVLDQISTGQSTQDP